MQRIVIEPHHSEDKLRKLEKAEKDRIVKERIRAVRLIGFSSHKKRVICEMLGRGRTTILRWCHRYNKNGIQGLRNQARLGGRVALCEQVGRNKIEAVLSQPPADGGLWTGPKLRAWLENEVGHPVGETQGWRTLRRLGYSLQVPKPANTKADKNRQLAFKKETTENTRRST